MHRTVAPPLTLARSTLTAASQGIEIDGAGAGTGVWPMQTGDASAASASVAIDGRFIGQHMGLPPSIRRLSTHDSGVPIEPASALRAPA